MSRMMENLIGIAALGLGAYIFVVYVLPQMGNIFPPAAATAESVVATDDIGLFGGNLENLLMLQSLGIDPADLGDLSKKKKKKLAEALGIDDDTLDSWIDGFDSGDDDLSSLLSDDGGDIEKLLKDVLGDEKKSSKSKSKSRKGSDIVKERAKKTEKKRQQTLKKHKGSPQTSAQKSWQKAISGYAADSMFARNANIYDLWYGDNFY